MNRGSRRNAEDRIVGGSYDDRACSRFISSGRATSPDLRSYGPKGVAAVWSPGQSRRTCRVGPRLVKRNGRNGCKTGAPVGGSSLQISDFSPETRDELSSSITVRRYTSSQAAAVDVLTLGAA
ncbi:unnamed protein product [Soboliphyme baturini]|uniref:Uncharacterized protein n=1 Tax=Soboliphyme baturini TaxID=241478 RepID=A0A183J489_9BILA|nr:unnamed protein product [Soboliphyme baturini]